MPRGDPTPSPQDVHPTAYATPGPPTVLSAHGLHLVLQVDTMAPLLHHLYKQANLTPFNICFSFSRFFRS